MGGATRLSSKILKGQSPAMRVTSPPIGMLYVAVPKTPKSTVTTVAPRRDEESMTLSPFFQSPLCSLSIISLHCLLVGFLVNSRLADSGSEINEVTA